MTLQVPVADAVYGYNQVEMAIDSYGSDAAFSGIPDCPRQRKSWGYLLFFTLFQDGVFREADRNLVEEITSMKSYLYMELFLNPGEKARKTTDCTSWGGVVSMAHADRDTLY